MTLKEKAYERLLHRVVAMCNDNQHVDWGVDEASEEFKSISNQIAWGMYEIEQADKENALEKIRILWEEV